MNANSKYGGKVLAEADVPEIAPPPPELVVPE